VFLSETTRQILKKFGIGCLIQQLPTKVHLRSGTNIREHIQSDGNDDKLMTSLWVPQLSSHTPVLCASTAGSTVLLQDQTAVSVSQEIPCLFWNPKVHNCVNKNLPPVPRHSHIIQTCFGCYYYHPSTSWSSEWPHFLRLFDQTFVHADRLGCITGLPVVNHCIIEFIALIHTRSICQTFRLWYIIFKLV
jgi:hypothetical protein